MAADLHPSIDERVAGFRQFYERRNERPLFGFFVGSEYPLHRYPASKSLPTDRPLAVGDFEVEAYVEDSHRLFAQHEACGGDFIWSASAFWGIPWLEAALGCPVFAHHATGSTFSQPPQGLALPGDLPAFDPGAPWPQKMDEFLAALSQASRGRWPIGTTRMRGIADLLAAVYGSRRWLLALIERPDEVQSVCARLTDFWIAFARFQLDRIPAFRGGVGSFYYNMWAPPGTVWHQEDAAALLSPKLYDQFIRPCDERIAEALDGCIMHLHPGDFVPVDACLEMNLTAIELHVDQGGKRAEDLFETHRKILDRSPLLIWGHLTDGDLDHIFSRLPAAGLAVMTVVSGEEEAARLWRSYAA